MIKLSGAAALVTGGTSGIGLSTAEALLSKGVNVLINARSEKSEEAERLAALADAHEVRCVFKAGDVADPESVGALPSAAYEAFGRLDVVVHAAGGPAGGTALQIEPDDWMKAFSVHVHSTYHLFRAAHGYLAERGGSMTLLSSAAALRGCPGTVAYQVVKASLIQMARALARDHAHENIRINCVAPGIIRTPFHAAMPEQVRSNNLANRIPLGREGTPEDVAALIVQLAENDFITGETMAIDGGMSMRMV